MVGFSIVPSRPKERQYTEVRVRLVGPDFFAAIGTPLPVATPAACCIRGTLGAAATDGLTYAAAAVALLGCTAVAGYLRARRASRIDPLIAMRTE